MKTTICTLHNKNYEELASITLDNKKLYCAARGYDLFCKTSGFTYECLGFEKIKLVLDLLEGGSDLVFWLGCDTLITNFNIKVEDVVDNVHDFFITSDSNWAVNADSFIVKNTTQSKKFFKKILNSYNEYSKNEYFEQAAILDIKDDAEFKGFCKILPQRCLNSYNYAMYPHIPKMHSGKDYFGNDGDWKVGDFVLHWPGMTNHNRISMAKLHSPYVLHVK